MIYPAISYLLRGLLASLTLVSVLAPTLAHADRIKDLTSVASMRSNQLIGYGLVVGLQGTGDGSDVSFTAQSLKTMLSRMGVSMEGPLADFEARGQIHFTRYSFPGFPFADTQAVEDQALDLLVQRAECRRCRQCHVVGAAISAGTFG